MGLIHFSGTGPPGQQTQVLRARLAWRTFTYPWLSLRACFFLSPLGAERCPRIRGTRERAPETAAESENRAARSLNFHHWPEMRRHALRRWRVPARRWARLGAQEGPFLTRQRQDARAFCGRGGPGRLVGHAKTHAAEKIRKASFSRKTIVQCTKRSIFCRQFLSQAEGRARSGGRSDQTLVCWEMSPASLVEVAGDMARATRLRKSR